jgi:hypothetical protein
MEGIRSFRHAARKTISGLLALSLLVGCGDSSNTGQVASQLPKVPNIPGLLSSEFQTTNDDGSIESNTGVLSLVEWNGDVLVCTVKHIYTALLKSTANPNGISVFMNVYNKDLHTAYTNEELNEIVWSPTYFNRAQGLSEDMIYCAKATDKFSRLGQPFQISNEPVMLNRDYTFLKRDGSQQNLQFIGTVSETELPVVNRGDEESGVFASTFKSEGSVPGDSGAPIVNGDNRIVALNSGGSDRFGASTGYAYGVLVSYQSGSAYPGPDEAEMHAYPAPSTTQSPAYP